MRITGMFNVNRLFENKRKRMGNCRCLFLALIVISSISNLSCQETVSPAAPFTEKYVLYSLINADTTYQIVYLSRSYNVDGYNPLDNTVDPALEGASVTLSVNNNKFYTLREGESIRTDTSRYKTPVKYYYLENYKPQSLDKVEITAILKNGVQLKSNTIVPPVSNVNFNMIYLYNPTVEGASNEKLIISWFLYNTQSKITDNYFAPRLDVIYSKTDDPDKMIRVKMPLYFVEKKETWMPCYPGIISAGLIHYYRDGVIRTLKSISEGDPNKENYIFHECEFTLLIMDKNLATFISAETTFKEEFSVRIDAPDFSNIQTGLGLFGAYGRCKTKLRISAAYIKSLGYKTSY